MGEGERMMSAKQEFEKWLNSLPSGVRDSLKTMFNTYFRLGYKAGFRACERGMALNENIEYELDLDRRVIL